MKLESTYIVLSFVLKEKEEGSSEMMTEEEVVEKKEATTTKNNREQSKFQTRKTENYYCQQCWIL